MIALVRSGTGSSPLTRGKRSYGEAGSTWDGLIPAHAGKTSGTRSRPSPSPAHPRSRGENSASALAFSRPHGSSPLTRGKLTHIAVLPLGDGLIPAHAGKTSSTPDMRAASTAHPRSRGENIWGAHAMFRAKGSSPLTRGKQVRCNPRGSCQGLIPAHAGKTMSRSASADTTRAHPRSRGENAQQPPPVLCGGGSSPLTRGKRRVPRRVFLREGLIPAHAGKTRCKSSKPTSATAHPRSRGENTCWPSTRSISRGSSPLTRGKRKHRRQSRRARRLIPAHAGKTSAMTLDAVHWWAHPRSRGENRAAFHRFAWWFGSSPLTRGKHHHDHPDRPPRGLIPAHAGKTPRPAPRGASAWAHPRSRGENTSLRTRSALRVGSSPLTRGKPSGPLGSRGRSGLIPAHAGKTLPDLRFYRADRSDLGKP